ncbi:hypothetical protein CRM73_00385 [Kocuria sp. CCUG 69068]|uniref:helix-turn-helix domain-containing protein n=1 Tax=Kocuria sp. CCUG 69068 TaxID=2043138 RepID=UPI001E5511AA|nr:hypothetical protein [Kocuria sp. CCUG 69068]
MHALGRYMLEQMDRQQISTAELIRRSGLSKQTVYNLLNDSRARMEQTPQRKTIEGLSRALRVPELDVLTAAAAAIGVRVAPSAAPLAGATDAQLLDELRVRLAATNREGDGDVRDAAPITRAGESPVPEHDLLQTPELALVSDEKQHPLDTPAEDELEQRRRERRVVEGGLPVDEELMAGYDAPQESILERDAQDADAEGSQLPPEEDA